MDRRVQHCRYIVLVVFILLCFTVTAAAKGFAVAQTSSGLSPGVIEVSRLPQEQGQVVVSFGISAPEAIPVGKCAMLVWETGAKEGGVSLNGQPVAASGERRICPEQTISYELKVDAPGGPYTKKITVPVDAVPPTEPPAQPVEGEVPLQLGLSDPEAIPAGTCVTLGWETLPAGDWPATLDGEPVPATGNRRVCPQTSGTYTYKLSVDASGGPYQKELTLLVVGQAEKALPPGEEPVVIEFLAEPPQIEARACATLGWQVTPAGDWPVFLDGEQVAASGAKQVCPTDTTTYQLVVQAPAGIVSESRTIQVITAPTPPSQTAPVQVEFVAEPSQIEAGACATLGWQVTPAGDWPVLLNGEQVAASGAKQVCPTDTTTYQLAAQAPGGTVSESRTIQVAAAPAPLPSPAAPTTAAPSTLSADLRPSDLYADKQPVGVMWGRITNDGLDTLTGQKVSVSGSGTATPHSGGSPQSLSFAAKEYSLNIAPGQTETINLGWPVDTSQYSYRFTLQVQAVGFTDPKGDNNSYTEDIVSTGPVATVPAAPPPAGPQLPPSQPSQPGWVSADVRPSDLYPDRKINGLIWARITNRGPGTLSNNKVEVSGFVTQSSLSGGTPLDVVPLPQQHTLNLKPGEQQAIDLGWPVDLSKYRYDVTISVRVVDFSDPDPSNNTYKERIEDTGGSQGSQVTGVTPAVVNFLTADLEVTDVYVTSMTNGDLKARLTNHGPDRIENVDISLSCILSTSIAGQEWPVKTKTIRVTLDPGKSRDYASGFENTDFTKYDGLVCQVGGLPFNDPDSINNARSEQFKP